MFNSTNTVTGKFSKQAEDSLSDERFREVEFAFDVTHFSGGAQTRFFNSFAAYITIMSEYFNNNYVPRNLTEVARICNELKTVLDQHIDPINLQPTIPGMEYTTL